MSFDVPELDWSDKRVVPGFQPINHLDVYDFRGSAQDVQLAATICAGIINRPRPRVYLMFSSEDEYWLRQLASAVPQTHTTCSGDSALVELLNSYQAEIKGLIIYDPDCIDSINVGTTLAGLRSGVVVSPTLAQNLAERCQFPLIMDLRTFQWRSRLQAYLWAKQHLLPECASRLIAGMSPTISNGLRSFLVATRTFVYWLDSRHYFPDGRAGLLSERGLMRQIFRMYTPNSLHLGWVIDEFSGIALLSSFAMAVLPSDRFNNLEVWTAIVTEHNANASDTALQEPPLPAIAPPMHNYDANKIYLSFTLSDGDNIQYCQHKLLQIWNEPVRGTIPLGWTLSPLLLQSAPAMESYYRKTATSNDELVVGPSGAGYMYPTYWPQAHLAKYLQQTGELMSSVGMTTLEVLDADRVFGSGWPLIPKVSLKGMTLQNRRIQQQYAHTLAPYGMRGIVSGNGFLFRGGRWRLVDDIPVCHNLGLFGSAKTMLLFIRIAARLYKHRPLFLNVYINAWYMGPTQIQQVMQQLGDEYRFVLPRTMLAMLAETQQRVL